MGSINWKQKLSSRKFWAMLAGFIASLLVCFNVSDNGIAQTVSVITAFGSIAVYMLSESIVDAAAADKGEKDYGEQTD